MAKIFNRRSNMPGPRAEVSATIGIDSTSPRITGAIHAASEGEISYATTPAITPSTVTPP